ncbi:MAG TPA: histidine phosphatase family protein [Acidimicrobiales bacterium]|nr:histidine phosphatase family protein [Acidimicrobiales bacterium]
MPETGDGAAAPLTRVLLIRHGEAQSAVDGVIGGARGCSGLSDLGRRQAAALRDRFARTGEVELPVRLYASTLPRAIETGRIVGEALGSPEIVTDCELCEVHTGDVIDGMTWEHYRRDYPREGEYDPWVQWGPDVETWAEFSFRTGRRLRRLVVDHPGETIVVACHGGVIRSSMQAFGGLPLEHSLRLVPTNTSVTEWSHQPGHRTPWHLHRYNDAAHLSTL